MDETVGMSENHVGIELTIKVDENVESEFDRIKELMVKHMLEMEDKMWKDILYAGVQTNTYGKSPLDTLNRLYDQNYRSAVLDKDGKFVRKID